MERQSSGKRLIGRVERVNFAGWRLSGIEAKVDTGAFTSTLHCTEIRIDRERKSVRFLVSDPEGGEGRLVECKLYDQRGIRSSNGVVEERAVVITEVEIGGETYKMELSLTDRSDMKYPVLIGRRFLRNKFIVDVSKKHMAGKTWRNVR